MQFKIAWSEESTLRQLSHDQNEGTSPQAKGAASPKPHSGNSFGVFEGLHEKAVNERWQLKSREVGGSEYRENFEGMLMA